MNKKFRLLFLFFFIIVSTLFAEKPEWINKLPFTEDAFWGVGEGNSLKEAKALARIDILMQLSTQVESVIKMEQNSDSNSEEIVEDMEIFFDSNTLRGAEIEDQYEENNFHWVLMKYCDDCGKMLINSALTRYEDQYNYESKTLMDQLDNSNILEIIRVERRLKELNLEDYHSDDISIVLLGKSLHINIINFLPYKTNLSKSQQNGLTLLSETLFEELKLLNYKNIDVIGHANPTGEANEEEELLELSKNRAKTMTAYLQKSGFVINSVSWKGGDEAGFNLSDSDVMGKNRRVEIIILFE